MLCNLEKILCLGWFIGVNGWVGFARLYPCKRSRQATPANPKQKRTDLICSCQSLYIKTGTAHATPAKLIQKQEQTSYPCQTNTKQDSPCYPFYDLLFTIFLSVQILTKSSQVLHTLKITSPFYVVSRIADGTKILVQLLQRLAFKVLL